MSIVTKIKIQVIVLTLDTGYDTLCFLSNIDSIYYTKIVETDAILILLTPNTSPLIVLAWFRHFNKKWRVLS